MRKFILPMLFVFALSACNDKPRVVNTTNYGVQKIVEGVITSRREVRVRTGKKSDGSDAGAIVGALAGSSLGDDGPSRIAGGIFGALAGKALTDDSRSPRTRIAYQYTVRLTRNGSLISVVVPDPSFLKGDRVNVFLGKNPKIQLRR